ncbi:hypothetical protein V8E51_013611 [Hyaloscypha variabilis]
MSSAKMFLDFAIVFSLRTSALAGSTTALLSVSIQSDDDYLALRNCAATCVVDLPAAIGCKPAGGFYVTYYNSCFCNEGFIPLATSYLGSCISSACSGGGVDYPAAVTVYEDYCITAGYPMNNVAQPTAAPSVVPSTVTAANGQASTVLFTVTPTGTTETQTLGSTPAAITLSTKSIESSSSHGTSVNTQRTAPKSLDIGPIIGGAVGGVLIIGIAATIITWMILREKRKRRAMETSVATTGPTFYPAPSQTSAPMRPKLQEGLISTGSPSRRSSVAPTPVPARVPVPRPADAAGGMIPLSPATLHARRNSTPGPPGYNEHHTRDMPEFMQPVQEMQGAGGLGAGHWEMQG